MTDIDTPPLEQHIADVIAGIIRHKEEHCIMPLTADIQEIMAVVSNNVKDSLNRMVATGLLTFHRTLNGATFEFTPSK